MADRCTILRVVYGLLLVQIFLWGVVMSGCDLEGYRAFAALLMLLVWAWVGVLLEKFWRKECEFGSLIGEGESEWEKKSGVKRK